MDMKYLCVFKRMGFPGRAGHSEKVREIGRRGVREEVVTNSSQFCTLFQ